MAATASVKQVDSVAEHKQRLCLRINVLIAGCYSSERIKSQCFLLIGITDKRFPRRTNARSDNSECVFNSVSVMLRFSVRT